MTRRRELEQHRRSLSEIRDIMNSMKTLAYMETRKLTRFIDAQHAVVQSIESAAASLLSFYPDILPEMKETTSVYLLIGTERGFCGDLNHALIREFELTLQTHAADAPILVLVGRKLHSLLEGDKRVAAAIAGANVVEEVTDLLTQATNELTTIQRKQGGLTLYGLYHNGRDGIVVKRLLPPFEMMPHKPPSFAHPPILNLSAEELLAKLSEHYLFASLHEMLYTALAAENYNRVTHLEGAVKQLDDKSAKLGRQCNALRQEEIIEEIEVILLSASNVDKRWLERRVSGIKDPAEPQHER